MVVKSLTVGAFIFAATAIPAIAQVLPNTQITQLKLPDPSLDYEHMSSQEAAMLRLPSNIANDRKFIRALRNPRAHQVEHIIGPRPGLHFGTSSNWSGTVIKMCNGPFCQASEPEASFTLPSISQYDSGDDWFAPWVGYQQAFSGTLWQSGFVQTTSGDEVEAWAECFPAAAVGLYSIAAGESVFVEVYKSGASDYIYSQDYTNGNSFFGYDNCGAGTTGLNEWIVEAPTDNNGHQTVLADYGTFAMSGATTGGGYGAGSTGQLYDEFNMVQNGVTASVVTILDNDDLSFTSYP